MKRRPRESAARPVGMGRSGPVAGCRARDAPQVPVPAKVVRLPVGETVRMRQAPPSATYRSPARLKAMAEGERNQASRAGTPSGAGLGAPPAITLKVDWGVSRRTRLEKPRLGVSARAMLPAGSAASE